MLGFLCGAKPSTGSLDPFSYQLKDTVLAILLCFLYSLYWDFQNRQAPPLRFLCPSSSNFSELLCIIIIIINLLQRIFYIYNCYFLFSHYSLKPSMQAFIPTIYWNSSCQIHWQPPCSPVHRSRLSPHYLTQLITSLLLKPFVCLALGSLFLSVLLHISVSISSHCPLLYVVLLHSPDV